MFSGSIMPPAAAALRFFSFYFARLPKMQRLDHPLEQQGFCRLPSLWYLLYLPCLDVHRAYISATIIVPQLAQYFGGCRELVMLSHCLPREHTGSRALISALIRIALLYIYSVIGLTFSRLLIVPCRRPYLYDTCSTCMAPKKGGLSPRPGNGTLSLKQPPRPVGHRW